MRVSLAIWAICVHGLLACSLFAEINVEALVTLKTDVLVPSRAAGTLGGVYGKPGDIVEPGQLLAELDATIAEGEYQASILESKVYLLQRDNDVDIRLSQKTRDVSQRELQRSLQANERYAKAVSNTELERLQMMVDQADLSEEKARLDLDVVDASYGLKQVVAQTNKTKIDMHRIVSPIRGMIVSTKAKAGEWLDVGQPFARVVQLDELRVEANIDGTQYGDRLVGQPVTFATEYGGRKQYYKGELVFVSPEIDPVDGMVRVWADVGNKYRTLKPGMRGVLAISTAE